jgi:hypothetical protein
MSKRINVNPDHYKVAGRERPGHAAAKERADRDAGPDSARQNKWRERQQKKDRERVR